MIRVRLQHYLAGSDGAQYLSLEEQPQTNNTSAKWSSTLRSPVMLKQLIP